MPDLRKALEIPDSKVPRRQLYRAALPALHPQGGILTYQAMFTETGRITAIPTKLTEHPQLEHQGNIFNWQETKARLDQWQAEKEKKEETE